MKQIDLPLFLGVTALTLFGLLMIYDASSYIAFRDFGDKYRYFKDQVVWIMLGFFSLMFFSYVNYKRLYNLSVPILLVAMTLLVLVFVPGIGVSALGARRWVNFGTFVLQPAEFVKLSLAIYLAAWFSNKEKGRLLAFLLLLGVVVLLVLFEPDMGTASIILSEALIVYFLQGGSVWHFILMVPLAVGAGFAVIKLEPYRAKRLATFLDPNTSLETTSYHVRQILIALGMGGITGVGLGNSLQKYAYLPENTTDSIFAIIGEELGLIGSSMLIMGFIFIFWRGFRIAIRTKDQFGRLLAGGIVSFLAIQAFINLGAQTALIPLTGVPLPFISYGGSALVVDMSAIGILLNISRHSIDA